MQVRCAHPSDEATIKVSISANVEQVSKKSSWPSACIRPDSESLSPVVCLYAILVVCPYASPYLHRATRATASACIVGHQHMPRPEHTPQTDDTFQSTMTLTRGFRVHACFSTCQETDTEDVEEQRRKRKVMEKSPAQEMSVPAFRVSAAPSAMLLRATHDPP
jgi:hypothetical protein